MDSATNPINSATAEALDSLQMPPGVPLEDAQFARRDLDVVEVRVQALTREVEDLRIRSTRVQVQIRTSGELVARTQGVHHILEDGVQNRPGDLLGVVLVDVIVDVRFESTVVTHSDLYFSLQI